MEFDGFGSGFDAGGWGDPGYGSFGLGGFESSSTGTNYGSWGGASSDWGSSYGGWDSGYSSWSDPGYGSFGLSGFESSYTGTSYGSWGGGQADWMGNYGSWPTTQRFDDGSSFTRYPDGSYGSTLAPGANMYSPTLDAFRDMGWSVKPYDLTGDKAGMTRVLGPGNVRFDGYVNPGTGKFEVPGGGVYAPDNSGPTRNVQNYAQNIARDSAGKVGIEDNASYKTWGELFSSWFGW